MPQPGDKFRVKKPNRSCSDIAAGNVAIFVEHLVGKGFKEGEVFVIDVEHPQHGLQKNVWIYSDDCVPMDAFNRSLYEYVQKELGQ